MQTSIKHIENYYRQKYGSGFDRIDSDENEIKIWFEGDVRQSIDNRLVKENNELIAWAENSIAASNFEIIIYNSLTSTAKSFPLYGEPDIDGYEFYSFVWINNSLFCIYMGDHDYFYIHTIENKNSKYVFVKGDAVRVFATFLTFQNYGINQPIYKVGIPQLATTNQFSEEEATTMNIMPSSLGLIYYPDHNFYSLD